MTHCDLRTGTCGPMDQPDEEILRAPSAPKATILYATDPICSHCWAMEPAWRKLLYHYGDQVAFRHIYGGLLPTWEGFSAPGQGIHQPADVATHWAEVAEQYGQPINPQVWLTDPLPSSYPPSIACHLVREMDGAKEEAFLRRIREAVFLEARNIARADVLTACAADVGLDPQQVATRLEQAGGTIGFKQDLQEVRRLPVFGFPTLIFTSENGEGVVLRGTQPYKRLEQALLKAAGLVPSTKKATATDLLAAYGSGTTLEFATALEMTPEEAVAALQRAGATAMPIAGDVRWSVR